MSRYLDTECWPKNNGQFICLTIYLEQFIEKEKGTKKKKKQKKTMNEKLNDLQ